MRNIEELAAEEEARIRDLNQKRVKALLFMASMGLGVAGWHWFQGSQMEKGSLFIVFSFFLLLVALGLSQALRFPLFAWIPALGLGAAAWGLYSFTKSPSFYWGKDASFWVAVDAGTVVDPPWSPLSYLVSQGICFLLHKPISVSLPDVSPILWGLCVFFLSADLFSGLGNRRIFNLTWCLLLCTVTALTRPFWGAATLASGVVPALGLLLLIGQRRLLELEAPAWGAAWLLAGLLFSVGPVWGILGLIQAGLGRGSTTSPWTGKLAAFAFGLTPYFWVFFRAGRYFPSWGGTGMETFLEWARSIKIFALKPEEDWSLSGAVLSLGWTFWVLVLPAGLILFWRQKEGLKSVATPGHWILLGLALAEAILSFSNTSGMPGPTAVFFVAGLCGMSLEGFGKVPEKKGQDLKQPLALKWILLAFCFLGLGLAFVPSQVSFREESLFPQQHALNLLANLGKRSVLVCEDPFEAYACLEALRLEPMPGNPVILRKGWLNQRWWIRQVIHYQPEMLFSGANGPLDYLFTQLIANNQEKWEIHWAVSSLPDGWKGPVPTPMILTQRFSTGDSSGSTPETAQYHYDLAPLLMAGPGALFQHRKYVHRYSEGFEVLGRQFEQSHNYSLAVRTLERAATLDPSYVAPKEELEQLYSRQNILEAARLEFEAAVKSIPRKNRVLEQQLEELQKNGNEADMAETLDQIVRLNAELADAQYHLGTIYERQGRLQESKALLEESVRLNPKRIESQLMMGRLMSKMGNSVRAKEAFRSVLEIDPQNKEAQKELWKLLNQR